MLPLPPWERIITSLGSVFSLLEWKEEKRTSVKSFQIALGRALVVCGGLEGGQDSEQGPPELS